MDCDGAQDEGYLPHAEHAQHGRQSEVSDRGVLGAVARGEQGPGSACKRRGKSSDCYNFISIYFDVLCSLGCFL